MKRRFRFSLKSLLLAATAVCLLFGLGLAGAMQRRRVEAEARALVSLLDGSITEKGWSVAPHYRENWLVRALGWERYPQPLWIVDLSGRPVTDDDLATLANCEWIRQLDLSNSTVGDAQVRIAAGIPKLVVLRLNNTKVTDKGLQALREARDLFILEVRGSPVSYAGLEQLDAAFGEMRFAPAHAAAHGPFPGIALHDSARFLRPSSEDMGLHVRASFVRVLHITDGSKFDAACWEHLRHLSDLRDISGSFGKRRLPGFENFAHFLELRRLDLDGGGLTDADLAAITKLPKLRYLSLGGWHELSDDAILQFGENQTIHQLDICGLRTTIGVARNLGGLRALEDLTLNIWQDGPNGKHGMPGPDQIVESVAAMRGLANLRSLRTLWLQGNTFTDEVLLALGHATQLTRIRYDDRFVTTATVEKLQEVLPGCVITTGSMSRTIDLD